jgi:hypothetical protein
MYELFYVLQFLIFLMGVAAVVLSGYFIAFFGSYKSEKNRGLRFTMQLFLAEQIVTSAGTLAFASSSLIAAINGAEFLSWNAANPGLAIVIRAAMFTAMLLSTFKLTQEVRKVASEQERENE